jgi:hypothetical protein
MQMYVEAQAKLDGKVQAGDSCHKESGFIQEIATEVDLVYRAIATAFDASQPTTLSANDMGWPCCRPH